MIPRILPFGDRAVLVELGDRFDEALVDRARAIADLWEATGHGPAVPAYASALLRFDPLRSDPAAIDRDARDVLGRAASAPAVAGRLVEVPVTYDGPDLEDTAKRSGMSVDDLVELHAGREYRAYFLGFLSGFAYCGRLDPRIAAPRLERPRERVPVGSVAIADGQTGIYPLPSPGGWRILGHTDLTIFDPRAEPPSLIRAGDRVRFSRA